MFSPSCALTRTCSAGGGAKRKATPHNSPTTIKKPREDQAHPGRDVNSVLQFASSSSSNPSPGYAYLGKCMWKIYSDIMLPPHKGVVPSVDSKQARLAIEKIVMCYSAMATDHEHALLVDDARDKKGSREILVKELDKRLARCFKYLYTTYDGGKVAPSVQKWLQNQVIMRASDVVWVCDVCPHASVTHCWSPLSLAGNHLLHYREPLVRPRQEKFLSQRAFRARQTQRLFCCHSGIFFLSCVCVCVHVF